MRRVLSAIIIPLFILGTAFAQDDIYFNLKDLGVVHDFRLESDIDGDERLSVSALTREGAVDQQLEGTYTFVINGYIEKLNFDKGVATWNREIDNHTFLYMKYEGKSSTIYHLYYTQGAWVLSIPLFLVILIPFLLILLTAVFRKLILMIIFLAIFVLFFLFNGLDLFSFFNLLKTSVLSLFS